MRYVPVHFRELEDDSFEFGNFLEQPWEGVEDVLGQQVAIFSMEITSEQEDVVWGGELRIVVESKHFFVELTRLVQGYRAFIGEAPQRTVVRLPTRKGEGGVNADGCRDGGASDFLIFSKCVCGSGSQHSCTSCSIAGGAERDRTADLLIANEALSQLSYSPEPRIAPAISQARRVCRERRLALSRRPRSVRRPRASARISRPDGCH